MRVFIITIVLIGLYVRVFAQVEDISESTQSVTADTTDSEEAIDTALVRLDEMDDTTAIVDTLDSAGMFEDTLAVEDTMVVEDTLAVDDTISIVESDTTVPDTTEPLILEEVPLTLDMGYRGFGWGMEKSLLQHYVEYDSVLFNPRTDAITFFGILGEDRVTYTYYFSDAGFWKTLIQFDVYENDLDRYINQFERIEKNLVKRYGNPKRTSRNDLGTKKEYWFSTFPKIARAYYRSSWNVMETNIELVLDAKVGTENEVIPVFDDLDTDLFLIYYRPDYYQIIEPDTTGIPEETILKDY